MRPGLFTGSWENAGMIYFPTILFKSMYVYAVERLGP